MNKTKRGNVNRSLFDFLTGGTICFVSIALFFERSVFNGHIIHNVELLQF